MKITPLMRSQVKLMAGWGHTQAEIAEALQIGENTIKRRLSAEFKCGLEKCGGEIVANLKRMASDTSGKHPGPTVTAAIFYCKARLGWRESMELTGKDGEPLSVRVVNYSKAKADA